MLIINYIILSTCFLISFSIRSHWAFDDHDYHSDFHHDKVIKDNEPLPKDKILLKDVKTLSFQRNKKTTSRRTHSIQQLSCVGGTAGCRLFTPNVVECENAGFDQDKNRFNWKCHADISDRVRFNHVEVICEGYDYPEDDYILLGSCGLEFTLDYTDPHDYHHNSYFKHLDEHEKEMHHERVREKSKKLQPNKQANHGHKTISALYSSFVSTLYAYSYLVGAIITLIFLLYILVRYSATSIRTDKKTPGKKQISQRVSSYGPLASAVLTTKKAC